LLNLGLRSRERKNNEIEKVKSHNPNSRLFVNPAKLGNVAERKIKRGQANYCPRVSCKQKRTNDPQQTLIYKAMTYKFDIC